MNQKRETLQICLAVRSLGFSRTISESSSKPKKYMKKITVIVKKEIIANTQYGNCFACALWQTLTNLGYKDIAIGGTQVRFGKDYYEILSGTDNSLIDAYLKKAEGAPYGDVSVRLCVPHLPTISPKEKVIYKTVVIDSAVKELQETLSEN